MKHCVRLHTVPFKSQGPAKKSPTLFSLLSTNGVYFRTLWHYTN